MGASKSESTCQLLAETSHLPWYDGQVKSRDVRIRSKIGPSSKHIVYSKYPEMVQELLLR
jgi:hypothetical protein